MLNLENLFFKCQQCYLSYLEKRTRDPFLKRKKKPLNFLTQNSLILNVRNGPGSSGKEVQ